ncbi:Sec-independent protein translocase protein TatB [Symbiobacterium thermophilum]|uniref:Sec-independent protein translocase protein TatA n=1 Tax=Symbiobacterium thermophilum (strain DSM 24528 / JCM 14929 / IAM 14863 / T) TaxID=292459 RepID=Q67N64_SYMTH|nr:Sec-independent protein translocase protein TatB [Symbiobacterium thermophilum]BAD40879.1 putative Sec-independent protein translocase [Symbiobacterium thermophilum IAM 14863]
MGNLGFTEILVIMIVALVVFGPNKLPELGRSMGQAIREFRKATQSITTEVTRVASDEVREKIDKAKSPADR